MSEESFQREIAVLRACRDNNVVQFQVGGQGGPYAGWGGVGAAPAGVGVGVAELRWVVCPGRWLVEAASEADFWSGLLAGAPAGPGSRAEAPMDRLRVAGSCTLCCAVRPVHCASLTLASPSGPHSSCHRACASPPPSAPCWSPSTWRAATCWPACGRRRSAGAGGAG